MNKLLDLKMIGITLRISMLDIMMRVLNIELNTNKIEEHNYLLTKGTSTIMEQISNNQDVLCRMNDLRRLQRWGRLEGEVKKDHDKCLVNIKTQPSRGF